ncbi:MAG: DUF1080 domain-containing protein, partial [Eudoraea sp.]|nr:DUF1080 domain-containing protein [Eudoraea sp.]
MIRVKIASLLFLGLLVSCNTAKKEKKAEVQEAEEMVETEVMTAPNTLTEAEIAEGWKLLFDGETTTGWRSYGKDTFPEGWVVADGMIHCPGSGRGEAGGKDTGDILYDEKFSNFHLKLEWKISEGGNSGIFYLGQESEDLDFIW